jgi:hypothetical protein
MYGMLEMQTMCCSLKSGHHEFCVDGARAVILRLVEPKHHNDLVTKPI